MSKRPSSKRHEGFKRIVVRLPLGKLWDEEGVIDAARSRWLNADDIRALLRLGRVRFVIANVGFPLRWVPGCECYHFWQEECRPHLADPDRPALLETFPNEYCYSASEWVISSGSPIVVLEMEH
jgi:hypothetical protein